MADDGRDPRRRRDGRDPALRPAARRAGRRTSVVVSERRPERAAELAERYGVEVARQRRGRRARPTRSCSSSSRRTWRRCSTRSRGACAPAALVVSHRRRHHDRVRRGAAARRRRRSSGSCRTPRRSSTRAWRRSARHALRRGAPGAGRGPARGDRQGGRVPENHQDAVTAISGSGPAYIFFVVEAMIEAGVPARAAARDVDRARRPDPVRRGDDARARPASTRPCCASR